MALTLQYCGTTAFLITIQINSPQNHFAPLYSLRHTVIGFNLVTVLTLNIPVQLFTQAYSHVSTFIFPENRLKL